jgi:C4-dicarboxylate-specific signal transduction histidine kinase
VLGVAFYLITGRGATSSVTGQILDKQELLARAEASNISSFFDIFGESVAILAQLKSIETRNANAARDMATFVDQWRDSDLNGGVILTDKDGIVKLHSSTSGIVDVGESLADRDYYIWAKNEASKGEYFVGKPVISRLGATKGQLIVAVASPVYQNDTFVGVVSASVKLIPLTHRYLELLAVSDETSVYLLSSKGELLYSNSMSDEIGVNIFDVLVEKPFSGSDKLTDKLKDVLSSFGEGSLKVSYLDPKSGEIGLHIVSYSPVNLDNQKWLLVMSSPAEKIWNFVIPIYIRIAILGLLVSMSTLMFGAIVVKEVKKQKLES